MQFKPLDVDSLVLSMDKHAILEIAMSLDIAHIRGLFQMCGEQARKHVVSALPKGMRERVVAPRPSRNGQDVETERLSAKAGFLTAYYKLYGEKH